jgi:hypothetical protein
VNVFFGGFAGFVAVLGLFISAGFRVSLLEIESRVTPFIFCADSKPGTKGWD